MNKKLTIIIFSVIIVVLVGAIVFSVGNTSKVNNTPSSNSKLSGSVVKNSNSSPLVVKDSKTYYDEDDDISDEDDNGYTSGNGVASNLNNSGSLTGNMISISELAKHNSETDCWVVYQGKIYDLTSWLTRHPGGVRTISPYCGTQGFEQAFINKHGNTKTSLFLKVAQLMGDFQLKGSLN